MKINEIEQLVGITKKNIRFYEQQGLLSPFRNKENGYREYSEDDVRTLEQIKLLRKLGLPLEEIRLMQAGRCTVADSMRRHLITLEREKQNLSQAEAFCNKLKNEKGTLVNLNARAFLLEMDQIERNGTSFSDKQKNDERMQDYIAPAIAALFMTAAMIATILFVLWAVKTDPSEAPPMVIITVLLLIPLFVIGGVLLALVERIKEIKRGEMDDAKKY